MDNSKNLRRFLMDLDRQFDKDTSTGGIDAWVSYFADDGVMVLSQGDDLKGRQEIYKSMERAFSLPEFSLRWEPIDAKVSEDGSLGYTYGKYVRRYLDDKGDEVLATGKYTTVWQKQRDGSWKIVLDIGN
ncbi:YybH family protein [Lutispora thermophila]|uniref:DUF4440 domain-containing protein n=1 Tax=Lutispora thermophila DSM 19022 TaxID=1122184 RepID=A0A1M6EFP5_9FIRM|nr:DUF4440 domain-containing protein [Lutispora thermophila]SHI84150.1 conserved hypothetical protein [Lutispora thermophila DSM 19022]